jgi:transcriptional regulator with XRE-family HTH domain
VKLAEVLDLTPNYVGALERSESLPTMQTLVVLAKALNISPAGVFGEPIEKALRKRMTGMDSLTVSVRVRAARRPPPS